MGKYQQRIRSISLTEEDDDYWARSDKSLTEEVRKMTKELREKKEAKI